MVKSSETMTMGEKIDPVINQHIQQEQSQRRQREREEYERRVQDGEMPWRESSGIMSVLNAVRDREFPCSFDRLRMEIGDREVVTAKGRGHPVSEVLDVVEPRLDPEKDPLLEDWSVPSIKDFEGIMQRHWEAVQYDDVPDDQKPVRGGANPHDPRTRG